MSSSKQNESGAYQQAGVDTAQAQNFIRAITPNVQQTHNKNVLQSLGGFSGLYELPTGYQNPVMVSCTDGVGTKLCLAIEHNHHQGIGIDLVAMCANDLLVCGGKPLYFLDYFATGQLELSQGQQILQGIVEGCLQADMALIGGETAEMPGLYAAGHYDLAGFSVGIVERDNIISGEHIIPGMHIVGIASSGIHANGFSLIRKIIRDQNINLHQKSNGRMLYEHLLEPTKMYCQSVTPLLDQYNIHGMVHITGGGFHENIPRSLPNNCAARIECDSFPKPDIINWLQEASSASAQELFSIFNMGIGFMIICDADASAQMCKTINAGKDSAWVIGEVIKRQDAQVELLSC